VVAELLGWFGAGLSCVISLPQVVQTMRAKRLDGISSATYWLVLANAATWTAWSLLTGEYAAGIPALVNGPIAIVILHRLVATRHTARRSESIPRFAKAYPSDSRTSRRQSPTEVPGGHVSRMERLPGRSWRCSGETRPWSGDLPAKGWRHCPRS
jgi:uncharacterized protein with PQ loop repeat